jgi:hypothetical protein
VSDLSKLPGKDLRAIRGLFGVLVEQMEESYDFSRVLNLQLALQQRGADALNFNHIRPLGWV